jgi:glycosyltransferase involved in cell wall biosynthesis
MNIYYITNSKLPTIKAHGYQISKMCEEFSNVGVKVELIFIQGKDKKENIFDFYKIQNNFGVKTLKIFNHVKYKFFLRGYSIFLQKIFFLLRCFFLKIPKGTIVYTREFEIAWLMNLRGFKTTCELHSVPEKKKKLFIFFLSNNIKYIFITKGILNEIQKYKKIKNYLIASDGVDLKLFDIDVSKEEAREKLDIPKDKKIILYTGHLYEWKGVDILAQTSVNLPNEYVIYFVGGTENDKKEFIERNKIFHNKIKLISHQKREIIPLWLKASDLLVLPNSSKEKISNFYTSPLKMFEYMVSKRPIVSSDLPSVREILNEENAVFFKSENSSDLSQKIIEIICNKKLSDKISHNAFNLVNKYSWEVRAQNIIKFLSL